MTINNDNSKPTDNFELLKQEPSACGPGCGCHAGGSSTRIRWIVGVIVLIAAGVLMARAVMKNHKVETDKAASGFAMAPTVGETPAAGVVPATSAPRQAEGSSDRLPGDAATNETPAASDTVAVREIGALSELNAVAADTGGVFVFLSGKNEPLIKAPLAQMRSAVRTIESQGRNKIGIFMLKTDSRDYEQVAIQTPVPAVIAMVKGRGMSAVSGDITETKLIQAFVAASSAGVCGSSSSGCGPSGCN